MAILRCKEPFSADVDGVPRTVTAGQIVDSKDRVVKGREHLFEPIEDYASRQAGRVEAATAAPGEKRSVPTKRAASADKGD